MNQNPKKYLIQCFNCGTILMKTKNPFLDWLIIEIKCPKCKKILKVPDEIHVALDKSLGHRIK